MSKLDEPGRKRLFSFLYQAFDDDNAGDMDAFVRNFLHNGAVWDAIADHFPDAPASVVRTVMLEAYGAWQQGQDPARDEPLH